MISVCIATYNGENFIKRQLDSILNQTRQVQEIIIVDDKSSDGTIEVIKGLKDERIKLYINEGNIGPIKSFERAIGLSTGEIIFLADQDDQWLLTKVAEVMLVHEKQNADLVVHDATVVDGDFHIIAQSWNTLNHNHISSSILRCVIANGFTGCMMSFNRNLAKLALPFPEEIEMHDQWLALVAMEEKKHIATLNKPLMNYVRHGNNVTAIKKRTISQIVKGRIGTIIALIKYRRR